MNRYFHALLAPEGDDASGGGSPQDPGAPSTPPKSDDTDVNSLKDSLAAARRREREAAEKLSNIEKELADLRDYRQKREDAEKTAEERLAAREAEWKEREKELSGYKEKWSAYEERQKAAVEEAVKDLTDDDRAIVEALPLDKQMAAVNRLKAAANKAPIPGGKGSIDGLPSLEDIQKMQRDGDPRWQEAYNKYRQHRR